MIFIEFAKCFFVKRIRDYLLNILLISIAFANYLLFPNIYDLYIFIEKEIVNNCVIPDYKLRDDE